MKSEKAFTLIELLVVIVIIAMLLAISAPARIMPREKAKEVVCKTNLRFTGLGMSMYIAENDGKVYPNPPNRYMWYDAAGNYLAPDHSDAYWGVTYKDYVGTPKVFGCPSFRRPTAMLYSPEPPELFDESAFALNDRLASNFSKISEIKSPSFFIICHDHIEPKIENGSYDMFHNDGPGTMNLRQYRQGGVRSAFYRTIFRHGMRLDDPWKTGGKANILWLDGHVSALLETTGDDVPRSWYEGQ